MFATKNNRFQKIKEVIDEDQIRTIEATSLSVVDDPLYPIVRSIILCGSARKASSIVALRVTHLTEVTQFMIILEG